MRSVGTALAISRVEEFELSNDAPLTAVLAELLSRFQYAGSLADYCEWGEDEAGK